MDVEFFWLKVFSDRNRFIGTKKYCAIPFSGEFNRRKKPSKVPLIRPVWSCLPHGKIQLCQLNSRSNPGGSNGYYSILCNRDFYCWLICNSAKDMTSMGLGAQPCCGLELSFLSISPHPCHYFLVVPYRPMAWRDSRIVLKTTSQAGRSGERDWLNNWIQTKIACDNWLESLL